MSIEREFTPTEQLPGQSFEDWVREQLRELSRISQEGGQLEPLSIDLDNLADGDLLQFDGTNGLWTNGQVTIPGSLPVADGDYGDITVSGTGTVYTIDPDTVTYDKMQDLSAAALLGGSVAGTVGEITLGTNLSFSGSTLNAEGGSKIVENWGPTEASFPVSNYATLDTRNTHPVLDFDTSTAETAYFHGIIPDNYDGEGLTVEVWWSAATATSGTVGWLVAFEDMDDSGLDIDGDGFASNRTIASSAVPGTSGQVKSTSVNVANGANMDNLAAGDLFRLRVTRNIGGDTAAGDAEIHKVEVRIQ